MENKKVCINEFNKLCVNYGFSMLETKEKYILVAKNTDNEDINWIWYNKLNDTVSYLGNTDNCNIWLCDTRKDFTQEKIFNFINDLNNVLYLDNEDKFKVSDLIDLEDLQEIPQN